MAPGFSSDQPCLALETSGRLGSVAVGAAGRVRAETRLEVPGNHAAELIPAIESALLEAGVRRAELAGIVVGSGPGSFTGVRIAAATAKGLAHALGLPLWAFSSLEAGAAAEGAEASTRYVLFDARGDRVYAACYRVEPGGIESVVRPHATRIGDLIDDEIPSDASFMGTGATRHRAVLEAARRTVLDEPAGMPTAGALLRLLDLHPDRPPIAAADPWEPEYVKASSAQRPRVG
jgi:tRNA threonylcarbamoyladenosine biosynthesis protein TsaB